MPRFRHTTEKQIPDIPFDQCRAKTTRSGKPGISVQQHCCNVWAVARALLEYLPAKIRQAVAEPALVAAALHDVGKVSPGFQKKYFQALLEKSCSDLARLPNTNFETNHAAIGQAAINSYFGHNNYPLPLALVAGAHHGKLAIDTSLEDRGPRFGGKSWALQRRQLIDSLFSKCGLSLHCRFPEKLWPVIAGLVTCADWIGSDEDFFPCDCFCQDKQTLVNNAVAAVRACGWQEPAFRPGLDFQQVFGFKPHRSQQAFYLSATEPGLHILEAPTGSGKTEAALFAAYRLIEKGRNNGIYFGLPTCLTSDKIHERVSDFLNRISKGSFPLRLAHGNAWLETFIHGKVNETEDDGGLWFTPRKRNLLCPFAVGTIDQALLSVMRVKHFFVRAFGLAGKVVILDEVHSYDGYTGTLMEHMINHLLDWGCTVMVLSATLTRQRRNQLLQVNCRGPGENASRDPYPLVSVSRPGGKPGFTTAPSPPSRKYRIHVRSWSPSSLAYRAAELARREQCVVCIANTVDKAQRWYDALASERAAEEFELGLLHSRFPAFARASLEDHWIKLLGKSGCRPKGCVLVATQVVEQSVDIDADVIFSELCPTDMLLQRMGRQWRHQRPKRPCSRPQTFILAGAVQQADCLENAVQALGRANCLVYAPYLLWRSYQVFASRDEISLPENVRNLLEETYSDPPDQPSFVSRMHAQLMEFRKKLGQYAQATFSSVNSLPVMDDNQNPATRYSDIPMVDVLLTAATVHQNRRTTIRLLDGEQITVYPGLKDKRVMARLHSNLLSMPAWRLARIGALETPSWLRGVFYQTVPVLEWSQKDGRVTFSGRPTGYTYDPVHGLRWRASGFSCGGLHPDDDQELGELDVFDTQRFQW